MVTAVGRLVTSGQVALTGGEGEENCWGDGNVFRS